MSCTRSSSKRTPRTPRTRCRRSQGVLKPTASRKVDAGPSPSTSRPSNGNSPYLVSSDNYNAIIVPKGTDYAKWDKTFIGTGVVQAGQLLAGGSGATFTANPDYWGGPPLTSTATAFSSTPLPAAADPRAAGRQRRRGRGTALFRSWRPVQLLNDASQYTIIKLKSSNHRELSMRNDQAPFTDARVRQAIAYSLDRPAMVAGAAAGLRRGRQRQPVRPHVSRRANTSVAATADPEHRQGQAAAAGGRPSNRASLTCGHRAVRGIAQLATRDRVVSPRRSGSRSASRSRPRPIITARRRTATPTGWMGRCRSSTTAAAASPTCSCRRRWHPAARGTRPTSRTRPTTSSSTVRGRGRPPDPAPHRRQDRDPAAPPDAARDPVLHRRPDRVDAEGPPG